MPEKMMVKPADGLVVRDPRNREPLPPEGREVERSSYWLRRLLEGDVTEVPATVAATPKGAVKPK